MKYHITAYMNRIIVLLVFLISILMFKDVSAFSSKSSHDVKVGAVEVPIYSVDVFWGKMQFVYEAKQLYEWSSETHEYDFINTKYSWSSYGNDINVANNSSFDVSVNCSYVSNYATLRGIFSKNDIVIEPEERTQVMFNLSGALNKNFSKFSRVGAITLKIS